jgi:outer membrane protein assembly factor BamB
MGISASRSVTACLLLGVGVAAWSAAAAAQIYPGKSQSEEGVAFQINPSRTGSIAFSAGFSAPLAQVWSYTTADSVSYPLVADDTVFVVAGGNDLFALDVSSGSKKWEHLLGGEGNLGAYDKGLLFFESSEGALSALKAKTGKQVWGIQVDSDGSASSPIAVNGQVFTAGPALTAVDEMTGGINWTQGIEATDGSAAYGEGALYVAGPCQYYAFATNGKQRWHDQGECEGGGGSSPAYFDKQDYLVDWATGNFVLDTKSGANAGTFAGTYPPTFFTGSNGRGYALEYTNAQLYCLDVRTGNVAWSVSTTNLSGQPIVINGQPVFGTSAGNVTMLDGASGTQLWTASVGSAVTSLNAGDGILVVAAGDSVYAFAPQ